LYGIEKKADMRYACALRSAPKQTLAAGALCRQAKQASFLRRERTLTARDLGKKRSLPKHYGKLFPLRTK